MARIQGTSRTEVINPTIRLVSMSSDPVGTIVSMWIGSRYTYSLDPHIIEDLLYHRCIVNEDVQYVINKLIESYPEYSEGSDYYSVIENVANLVIKSGLPLLDSINFVFEIDNANVAWREQLVRGRQPQNFWMQTSRTADLTTMDVNRLSTIEQYGGKNAVEIYDNAVETIRKAYSDLIELGVPSEDIRLIPQGMTHRVYWMVPFRTLTSVFSKRTSWIAQSVLWSPVIEGVISEIRSKSPFLANIIGVPNDVKISDGKIISHSYDNENEDRYYGRDYQPADPLWLCYRGLKPSKDTNFEMYDNMKKMYIKIWNDEVCDILGWDKNNPDKLGYFDRP